MNLKDYLRRIDFNESIFPDTGTLKKLHKNHIYNIPFENLDIHFGNNILLGESNLTGKILNSRRGGYCYELNRLFYLLLKEIGFNVKIISARVNNGKGGWGNEFDHMAILVTLKEQWIADVGFGDSFIEPLRFELDRVQEDINGFYKIVKYNEEYYELMKSNDGKEFTGEYIFSLKERTMDEFTGMNFYHQTSRESHFTKNKVCTIAKVNSSSNGRITLTNNKLITTDGDQKITSVIKDEEEFKKNLFEYFRIKI